MDLAPDRPRGDKTQLKGNAMERTLISWNLPNWITISLMAAGSYALVGLVAQLLKGQQTQAASVTIGQF